MLHTKYTNTNMKRNINTNTFYTGSIFEAIFINLYKSFCLDTVCLDPVCLDWSRRVEAARETWALAEEDGTLSLVDLGSPAFEPAASAERDGKEKCLTFRFLASALERRASLPPASPGSSGGPAPAPHHTPIGERLGPPRPLANG